MNDIKILTEKVSNLPNDWHGSGSLSPNVLQAIVKYATNINEINFTAETGCGRSTLLLSHLSKNHLVFSVDNWNSMAAVKNSELLNKKSVKFVEGPTQKTLPEYNFNHKFQIVLLDGPHGYPFPELEYFFFYPNIEKSGLLLIDDIQIPTIRNMYKILKADDMWNLLDVIDDFAIFQRTGATLIDPYSDSWWLQGYNLSLVKQNKRKERIKHFFPKSIASRTPKFIKRIISKLFSL